jgi:spermidine synthase
MSFSHANVALSNVIAIGNNAMMKPSPKNTSAETHPLLFEAQTPHGHLAVYETPAFGRALAINQQIVLSEKDSFFYDEMISHPALFTHPRAQKLAIIGRHHGTLQEVLKHLSVNEIWCVSKQLALEQAIQQHFSSLADIGPDARVQYHDGCPIHWIKTCQAASLDIIIHNHCASFYDKKELQEHYQTYYHALGVNGMILQPCPSALLNIHGIKTILQTIQLAGFQDWQLLNFPQPSYPTGTRTILLATKDPKMPRIREKDIYNRRFTTRYYNYDTHRAALAMPEFVQEALLD